MIFSTTSGKHYLLPGATRTDRMTVQRDAYRRRVMSSRWWTVALPITIGAGLILMMLSEFVWMWLFFVGAGLVLVAGLAVLYVGARSSTLSTLSSRLIDLDGEEMIVFRDEVLFRGMNDLSRTNPGLLSGNYVDQWRILQNMPDAAFDKFFLYDDGLDKVWTYYQADEPTRRKFRTEGESLVVGLRRLVDAQRWTLGGLSS